MKGDFSRLTWDRRKHYSGVLMQQGRLQLDADWNEQIDIIMHRLETEVADYVGHSGVPAGSRESFRVDVLNDPENAAGERLRVMPGRIYVEGRLVQSESAVELLMSDALPAAPERARAIVYLDVWERLVTFVDDPDIREVALGGPDTATRRQTAWAVRAQYVAADTALGALPFPWQPAAPRISSGLLNARLSTDLPSLENQLYRVEIHSVDAGGVHFTWSRDNASVLATITDVQRETRSLRVSGGGRDRQSALADRQWVELLTRAEQDAGARGHLVQIDHVVDNEVVISADSWPWAGDVPALAVLRRWDNLDGLSTGAVLPQSAGPGDSVDPTAGWVALESGIEVRFESSADGDGYLPGDYWLIPARTATSAIDWPVGPDGPAPQPAAGVLHSFAVLAMIEHADTGGWSVPPGGDLRVLVSALDDGFVSRGAAGSTMRGPLTVQPLLAATGDDQTLVGLLVDPAFDDAGHGGGQHIALQVTGDTVLGTEEHPVSSTAYGFFNVLGASYTRSLTVNSGASMGSLSISGRDGNGDPAPQWALKLGETDPIGLDVATAPDVAARDANVAAARTAAANAADAARSARATKAAAATTASNAAADAAATHDAAAAAAKAAQDANGNATTARSTAATMTAAAATNPAAAAAAAVAKSVADTAEAAAAQAARAAQAATDKATAADEASAAAAAAATVADQASAVADAAADAAAAAVTVAISAGAAGSAAAGDANVGYLRFGDGTGKKFHLARAREIANGPDNIGTAGALVTFTDNGMVGIDTTNPALPLHVANRAGGMSGIAMTSVSDMSLAAILLRRPTTPNSTLFIAGVAFGDSVQLFWKSNTGLLFAAGIPANDQLTNQLRGS